MKRLASPGFTVGSEAASGGKLSGRHLWLTDRRRLGRGYRNRTFDRRRVIDRHGLGRRPLPGAAPPSPFRNGGMFYLCLGPEARHDIGPAALVDVEVEQPVALSVFQ